MSDPAQSRPLGLSLLGAAYFFFFLLTVSTYGDPFPFLGTLYVGPSAQCFSFADSLISLYLVIGIFKRQRLTAWLLIFYNLIDVANACVNLLLIPVEKYASLMDVTVSEEAIRFNTLAASLILVLLSSYVFRNRRFFDNRSPYLF